MSTNSSLTPPNRSETVVQSSPPVDLAVRAHDRDHGKLEAFHVAKRLDQAAISCAFAIAAQHRVSELSVREGSRLT